MGKRTKLLATLVAGVLLSTLAFTGCDGNNSKKILRAYLYM